MTEVGPDHLLGTAASVVLVPGTKVHDAHTLVKGQWADFIKERDGVVKLLRTRFDAIYKNTVLKGDLPANWLQQVGEGVARFSRVGETTKLRG